MCVAAELIASRRAQPHREYNLNVTFYEAFCFLQPAEFRMLITLVLVRLPVLSYPLLATKRSVLLLCPYHLR